MTFPLASRYTFGPAFVRVINANARRSFASLLPGIFVIFFSLYGHHFTTAFMNVDENIGKAIGSAGTLTEGVAGIFKAFEGDKVNGLGLMSGIQGGFAGLQGLFGGEAGSDSSQLLGGMGGVAGLLTGRAFGSFQFRLANT